jgi:tetratricopeptide (TPR) repeat protein
VTGVAPPNEINVDDSGAVAGHDVVLRGITAAGRDVIIRQQTVHVTSAPTVRPAELLPEVAVFVDREDQVGELCRILAADRDEGPAMVLISGPPGVGKTALALRVAQRVRGRFDSGSLFIDLAGAGALPLRPDAVLEEFLLALGANRVPQALDDRARLYRSLLASGRYLVVLDNVHDITQLWPLLPGSADCAVLITSRRWLVLPELCRSMALEALTERFGVELLAAIAGQERIATQVDDAVSIVASCGGLPLAIGIAAARLAVRPHWRLQQLARRLTNVRRRLGELDMGDIEVRAGFELSYRDLGPEAQRLFRLLGLVHTVDFPPWLPAVLLDTGPDEAEEYADQLCEAHLLQILVDDEDGVRYGFHDLLRAFAAERLAAETDEAERSAALTRGLDGWIAWTLHADAAYSAANSAVWDRPADLSIPDEPITRPTRWFDRERANLLRVIEQAHSAGRWPVTWRLASAMWQYLEITARWTDWRAACGLGLDGARRAGDPVAEGSCLRLLGRLELASGHVDEAAALLGQALEILSEARDAHGEAMSLKDMSVVERLRNRHVIASELLLEALDGFRRLDAGFWTAIVRRELGIEYRYQCQWEHARRQLTEGVAAFIEQGERLQIAQTRFELGVVDRLSGDWDAAEASLTAAGEIFDDLGARRNQAWVLRELALVAAGRGEIAAAIVQLERCLQLWGEMEDARQHAGTLHELALLHQRRGELDRAMDASARAADIFEEVHDAHSAARVLVTFATQSVAAHAPERAVPAAERALDALRAGNDLLWEVRAQRALASAHTALDNERAARDAAVLAEGLARYARATDDIRI